MLVKQNRFRALWTVAAGVMVVCVSISSALAQGNRLGQMSIPLRDVVRIKGQETTTLHGMGLVSGLNGTGGLSAPEQKMLATFQGKFGVPVQALDDLKGNNNVALVYVDVTVPAIGAREGGRLDCVLSANSAKSLEGGFLLATSLGGLNPLEAGGIPSATASGPLRIDSPNSPNTARITQGCRLQRDFLHPLHDDDFKVTLVLHERYAGFEMARNVAFAVNEMRDFQSGDSELSSDDPSGETADVNRGALATDQRNVEVIIPKRLRKHQIEFFEELFRSQVERGPDTPLVVIYESTGVIAIHGAVEIFPVAITVDNLSLDVGGGNVSFVGGETGQPATAKLTELVSALNALRMAPRDQINVIKAIDEAHCLHGQIKYVR